MAPRGKKKWGVDPLLLGIIVLLVFLGILILASVSASFSLQTFNTTYYFLNHQLLLGLLPGLLLGGFFFFFVSPEMIKKWAPFVLLFNIILLALVFFPVIGNPEGAHRWIFLGPFSFQPSEALKLTFILYLASLLAARVSRQGGSGKKKPGLVHRLLEGKEALFPFAVVTGLISLLLVAQPDVSTLGVIGLTGIIMYFAAGTPWWHTPFMLGGGFAVLLVLIQLAPYRFSRLKVFLDPLLDPLGQGYQIKQALIGIGSGGLFGVGLGLSFQKFGFLPEPISDSIFAVIAEELGFFGASFIILLFLVFAWRSFILAKRIEDPFSRIATLGIASWITLQAFVNMGSITGLLPLTGIPLPFISYGGSALAMELLAMGILLKITSHKPGQT
jgi:cell division protein FtsW